MTRRLCEESLTQLPASIAAPRYDRHSLRAGIVHLGTGAFHRAHQAWYTERALNQTGGDWGIVGASLRSPDIRDRLQPQDGLYSLVARDGNHVQAQIIGAIQQVIVGPENPQALLDWLSHPDIRIITLTITEKGYCCNASNGSLDLEHPDIRRDIETFPSAPVTAIGYLAASLSRRCQTKAGGVTLLSCDNLSHNGKILQRAINDLVAAAEPSLLPWIEAHITFPCSMVDRIVPATTAEDLSAWEQQLGCRDEAAVFTEPFSQWVVENDFARGAPAWEAAGVLLTDDVTPFETLKLRLLNGSHSLIAYLGYLAGYDYVHQVMADPQLAQLIREYMDHQAQPSLAIPSGFDIESYKNDLCRRFGNAALRHKTYQIAQDGSRKIPQRWLAAVNSLQENNIGTGLLALGVAAWIRYLQGRRDNGETFVVDDPLVNRLQQSLEHDNKVESIFEISEIFGDLNVRNPDFLVQVQQMLQQLTAIGVKQTAKHWLASSTSPRENPSQ